MMKGMMLVALATAGLLCACSSTPTGTFKLERRRVTIRTEPEGARVTQILPMDQKPVHLGVTPLVNHSVNVLTDADMSGLTLEQAQEMLEQGDNVVVLIERDGYETRRAALETKKDEATEHMVKLVPKGR